MSVILRDDAISSGCSGSSASAGVCFFSHPLHIAHGRDANIPLLQTMLKNEEPIWPSLFGYMQLDAAQARQAKPILKIALYSCVFGKNRKAIEQDFTYQMGLAGLPVNATLFDEVHLQALLEGMEYLRKQIKQQGGMQTPYGWKVYTPGENINKFLAQVVQAYEVALIVAVYEEAMRYQVNPNHTFYVVLHQHDGVSLLLQQPEMEQYIRERLQKAVSNKARLFNMYTSIA